MPKAFKFKKVNALPAASVGQRSKFYFNNVTKEPYFTDGTTWYPFRALRSETVGFNIPAANYAAATLFPVFIANKPCRISAVLLNNTSTTATIGSGSTTFTVYKVSGSAAFSTKVAIYTVTQGITNTTPVYLTGSATATDLYLNTGDKLLFEMPIVNISTMTGGLFTVSIDYEHNADTLTLTAIIPAASISTSTATLISAPQNVRFLSGRYLVQSLAAVSTTLTLGNATTGAGNEIFTAQLKPTSAELTYSLTIPGTAFKQKLAQGVPLVFSSTASTPTVTYVLMALEYMHVSENIDVSANSNEMPIKGSLDGAAVPNTSANSGDRYVIYKAGTSQAITWAVNDHAVYLGSSGSWGKITPAAVSIGQGGSATTTAAGARNTLDLLSKGEILGKAMGQKGSVWLGGTNGDYIRGPVPSQLLLGANSFSVTFAVLPIAYNVGSSFPFWGCNSSNIIAGRWYPASYIGFTIGNGTDYQSFTMTNLGKIMQIGQWMEITYVVDRVNHYFYAYLNGEIIEIIPITLGDSVEVLNSATTTMDYGQTGWQGYLGKFQMWRNCALTAAEVAQVFNGEQPQQASMIIDYDYQLGIGKQIVNKCSNRLHALMYTTNSQAGWTRPKLEGVYFAGPAVANGLTGVDIGAVPAAVSYYNPCVVAPAIIHRIIARNTTANQITSFFLNAYGNSTQDLTTATDIPGNTAVVLPFAAGGATFASTSSLAAVYANVVSGTGNWNGGSVEISLYYSAVR